MEVWKLNTHQEKSLWLYIEKHYMKIPLYLIQAST